MILSSLNEFGTYVNLHPLFSRIESALITMDFTHPGERIYIEGDNLYATPSFSKAKAKEEALLEAHDRYIDVQVCLQGEEIMGWRNRSECLLPKEPYNEKDDITFFSDPPATFLKVPAYHFVIFYPADCHAPLIGTGLIKKVVFKVKL
ncbi:MAG TPA: YhcH/YjgK/YiaL family protein [Tenuifilaceae bacterium]|nr:YhcH/YjgK/YiaL family protein [Tenuifilaceae bacterium]